MKKKSVQCGWFESQLRVFARVGIEYDNLLELVVMRDCLLVVSPETLTTRLPMSGFEADGECVEYLNRVKAARGYTLAEKLGFAIQMTDNLRTRRPRPSSELLEAARNFFDSVEGEFPEGHVFLAVETLRRELDL